MTNLQGAPPGPINVVGYDNFSYPYVDWPWRLLESKSINSGQLPLWNEYASLGLPFPGQFQNQLFFPLEWIEIYLGILGRNIFLVVKIFFAGLGAYFLSLYVVKNKIAALAGGVSYSFSAYFIGFQSIAAFVNGAMLVPWLFLFTYRISFQGISSYRIEISALGIISGLIMLTGQPQISILSFIAAFIMVICSLFRKKPISIARAIPIFLYLLALLIGACIASIQLSFFWEMAVNGYSLHTPGAYAGGGTGALNFFTPLWPFLLGQFMSPWDGSLYPSQLNHEALPILIGTVQLVLCSCGLIGIFKYKNKFQNIAALRSLLVIAIIIIIIIISGTLGYSLWRLPILDRVNFPRYSMPIVATIVAIFSSFGLELLARRIRITWIYSLYLTVVIMVAALLMLPLSPISLDMINPAGYIWQSIALGVIPFVLLISTLTLIGNLACRSQIYNPNIRGAILLCLIAELYFWLRLGFAADVELFRLFSVAIICLSSIFWLRSHFKISLILFFVAIFPIVFLFELTENHMRQRFDPFATSNPHILFLQSKLGANSRNGRILPTVNTIAPNTGSAFGIAELASLNPNQIKTTAQYILRMLVSRPINYTTPVAWTGMCDKLVCDYPSWSDYYERRDFYNLIGVRFLIDNLDGELSVNENQGILEVYRDNKVRIFEDANAFPRAFAMNEIKLVKTPGDAFEEMLKPNFQIRKVAVVEGMGSEMPKSLMDSDNKSTFRELGIAEITALTVRINVNSEQDEIIVLSDAYYPGWVVKVDGKPSNILRVAGSLRGVIVPSGVKEIIFTYKPPEVLIFGLTSLLSFFAAVLCLLSGWNKFKQRL